MTNETNLQTLQREARDQIFYFPGKYWLDTENVSIAHGKLCELVEAQTKRAYLQGIRDAKGALPEEKNFPNSQAFEIHEDNGFNECRKETLEAITRLEENVS